jgi:putative ABC transport system permease protein
VQATVPDRDPIDAAVTLNGMPYTVIGKIRKKTQDSNYTGPDNNRLFVPYETMRKDFPLCGGLNTADSLSTVIAAPYDEVAEQLAEARGGKGRSFFDNSGPVETEVRQILGPRPDFDPQDHEALSMWNTAIGSVMFVKIVGSMKEFFIAVSIIMLALGGIGVMNIMLVAVKERTKEIGVRKALGATSGNIQRQFLSEGLLLTLMSGAAGLGLGAGLCHLINLAPMPDRFAGMIITWQTAGFALLVLVLIGALAALYPARRAAELPPIEALRFES